MRSCAGRFALALALAVPTVVTPARALLGAPSARRSARRDRRRRRHRPRSRHGGLPIEPRRCAPVARAAPARRSCSSLADASFAAPPRRLRRLLLPRLRCRCSGSRSAAARTAVAAAAAVTTTRAAVASMNARVGTRSPDGQPAHPAARAPAPRAPPRGGGRLRGRTHLRPARPARSPREQPLPTPTRTPPPPPPRHTHLPTHPLPHTHTHTRPTHHPRDARLAPPNPPSPPAPRHVLWRRRCRAAARRCGRPPQHPAPASGTTIKASVHAVPTGTRIQKRDSNPVQQRSVGRSEASSLQSMKPNPNRHRSHAMHLLRPSHPNRHQPTKQPTIKRSAAEVVRRAVEIERSIGAAPADGESGGDGGRAGRGGAGGRGGRRHTRLSGERQGRRWRRGHDALAPHPTHPPPSSATSALPARRARRSACWAAVALLPRAVGGPRWRSG